MQVFFTNLGCKLNQAEVDAHARRFVAAGHDLAPCLAEADLHVVNSCTVTHLAARDSRKTARRGQRLNSDLRTVLTGCYASSEPEEAAHLAGVDLVVTNDRKDDLLELVHEAFPESLPIGLDPIPFVPLTFGRARALVKIEDGCNMRCAFCIIPSTRGRQRSRPVEEVVKDVRELHRIGYPEVVVTGVQISEYTDESRKLFDLVNALLDRTEIPRIRLTSIAPWKFDQRLIDLWSNRRLCRHIHMSLQSGSTATLRRMRRPYTAARYAALAERLRAAIPGLALTTDVIVGFPGETDQEFAESLRFVEKLSFAKPHIFSYSQRAGTEAASLPNQVSPQEKKLRMATMRASARRSDRAFTRAHLGKTLGVVWEESRNGYWRGLTDNYIRVFANDIADLSGTLERVELKSLTPGGALARRVS